MRQKCSSRFENEYSSNSAVAEPFHELVQYFSCKDRLVATPFNAVRLVILTCRRIPDSKFVGAIRVLGRLQYLQPCATCRAAAVFKLKKIDPAVSYTKFR